VADILAARDEYLDYKLERYLDQTASELEYPGDGDISLVGEEWAMRPSVNWPRQE